MKTPNPSPIGSGAGDDELRDKIANLLADDWACTRVWEAWGYNTMTQDDFEPLSETERVDELLELIHNHTQAAVAKAEREGRIDTARKILHRGWCIPDMEADVEDYIAQLQQPQEETTE